MTNRFIIRVYGILIHNNAVLVSDETIAGKHVTKFPGGGLEFGEGTLECLEREFYEELNLKINVTGHFYTTDFYVPSAFDPSIQVISIYYLVDPVNTDKLQNPRSHTDEKQTFRWIQLDHMRDLDFTLVIDKRVANMIIERFLRK
ncbi:MAG TPA: NUDIX domain-containing protein [Bacteroidia bacterium]|nr:NUDIX domain-containing protein [Bacteroidia bacterium]